MNEDSPLKKKMKVLMNEDNPPMALPNGQVYGKEALLALAAENAGV